MEASQLKFVNEVSGIEADLAAFADRETDRRAAFDVAMRGLAEQKDKIRENMKVQLVDSKGKKGRKALSGDGQEHDLDTFKATRKGQGLTAKDMKKAGTALKPISDAAQAILATVGRDGKPLFKAARDFVSAYREGMSPEEEAVALETDKKELKLIEVSLKALTDELFTPLVREGVLPENFVTDQYSEVQQLLDATFASYKARNHDERDEAEQSHAKAKGKYHGSGTGTEQFGAVMQRLASAPTRLQDKMGIDKNARRRLEIVKAGGSALVSMAQMGMTMKSWQVDESGKPRIESNFAKQLDPSIAGFTDKDPDQARADMIQAKRAAKISGMGFSKEDETNIINMLKLKEDNNFNSSKDGILDYGAAIKDIVTELAIKGDKLDTLRNAINSAHHEAANIEAAEKAAKAIDAKLVAMLDKHIRPGVGKALAGMYANAVDMDEVGEAASLTKPDDQTIIQAFALAFEQVFSQGLDPALAPEGKTVMKAFLAVAEGGALQKALKADPPNAFAPLVTAAESMLDRTLAAIPADKKRIVDGGVMKSLLRSVAQKIDAALVTALKADAGAVAAEAFEGLYAAEVDLKGATDAATATPADGAGVILSLANAFHSAMAQAAPDPSNTAFIVVGKKMAAAMKSAADAGALTSGLATDPGTAFRAVLTAADTAISTGLAGATAMTAALNTPEAQKALAAKSAFPDGGADALAELEASDEELREYERQLVLVDEGGIAAAELRSIESLIEKLERDKMIAEMILASADILTNLAGTSVGIAGQQTLAVTDTIVAEVVGPLKAAKLIIKFAVAMKAANDRRILLQKFSKSLKLAKHAVSPMQSTIQGFFNNKVEQVTFRAIEDALTLIQIAAAILGSVPEPITLAVGKTMGAVATAGEGALKVSEMLFNEAMLSKGWSTTLAAIRNPRDRATGLAALKLNPTLGMHALAWAGMEKTPPDPIARNLLDSLGLNEQTLQVSGSEAKVRKYLETLLAEDRTLLDPDLISPVWIPKPLTLSTESWVVATHRAATLAEPKLRKSNEPELLVWFKKKDALDITDLETKAKTGLIETDVMEAHRADAARLSGLLRAYRPVASDGSEHDEMVSVAADFMKKASDHEAVLLKIAIANADFQAKDVGRVSTRTTTMTSTVNTAITTNTEEALQAAFKASCELIREIQIVRMDENDTVRPLYETLLARTQLAGTALQTLVDGDEDDEEEDVELGKQPVTA